MQHILGRRSAKHAVSLVGLDLSSQTKHISCSVYNVRTRTAAVQITSVSLHYEIVGIIVYLHSYVSDFAALEFIVLANVTPKHIVVNGVFDL